MSSQCEFFLPVARSHNLTVPSLLPLASVWPSGEKARHSPSRRGPQGRAARRRSSHHRVCTVPSCAGQRHDIAVGGIGKGQDRFAGRRRGGCVKGRQFLGGSQVPKPGVRSELPLTAICRRRQDQGPDRPLVPVQLSDRLLRLHVPEANGPVRTRNWRAHSHQWVKKHGEDCRSVPAQHPVCLPVSRPKLDRPVPARRRHRPCRPGNGHRRLDGRPVVLQGEFLLPVPMSHILAVRPGRPVTNALPWRKKTPPIGPCRHAHGTRSAPGGVPGSTV